jgi:Sec-independent protein translocase protein TatA
MVFGMTRGEIGLTLFIFLLVLGSGILPRLGERVGAWLADRKG